MRNVGIDELAVRIEIDGADMQRLVQITEEMRKQKQGFLLVLDRERKRRRDRLVRQHRDRSANGGDQVVVIGALEAPVKAVALDGDVIEMVGVVAAPFESVRLVRTGIRGPVSLDVIDHPRPFLFRVVRRAGHLIFEMFRIDLVVKSLVVMANHALDAIGPRRRLLQVQFTQPARVVLGEDLPDLLLRVVLQQFVGDRAHDLVALIAPGRRGDRIKQAKQAIERKDHSQHAKPPFDCR